MDVECCDQSLLMKTGYAMLVICHKKKNEGKWNCTLCIIRRGPGTRSIWKLTVVSPIPTQTTKRTGKLPQRSTTYRLIHRNPLHLRQTLPQYNWETRKRALFVVNQRFHDHRLPSSGVTKYAPQTPLQLKRTSHKFAHINKIFKNAKKEGDKLWTSVVIILQFTKTVQPSTGQGGDVTVEHPADLQVRFP